MSDSFDYAPVTYTMKGGKGYEEPWVVFHGTPASIRRNALSMFGMDEDQFEGVPTSAVMSELNEVFNGDRTVMKTLGGTTVKQKDSAQKPGGDPWASSPDDIPTGAPKDEDDPVEKMIERVNSVADVNELKALWAKNKELFNDSRLMDAYKAKGKSLTAAA